MLDSPATADHRAARRRGHRIAPAALAAVAVSATALTAVVVPVASAAPRSEHPGAAQSVTALAEGALDPATLPADFAATFGYTPVPVDGTVIKPSGECSSPVPLPAEFETPCKAHDLGYDLLRYAHLEDSPLGPWARRAIDAALDRAMDEACATRTATMARARCHTVAAVASVVVDLNSRREGYGSPVIGPVRGRVVEVAS